MIILLAIRIILKTQFLIKMINLSIFIKKENRLIKLIFEFSNNAHEDVNIFLRFIFADNQDEGFQFKNNEIKNIKISKFIFFEFFLNISDVNVIFDLISKIIFAASLYHRADFIIRFDLNYDIRFDNDKFCFDDEAIIHNFFDFNDKMYDRFDRIDFNLIS